MEDLDIIIIFFVNLFWDNEKQKVKEFNVLFTLGPKRQEWGSRVSWVVGKLTDSVRPNR